MKTKKIRRTGVIGLKFTVRPINHSEYLLKRNLLIPPIQSPPFVPPLNPFRNLITTSSPYSSNQKVEKNQKESPKAE
jgi:hypothetical protein